MSVRDVDEALALLDRLGASAHLVRHHRLVAEAAQELTAGLKPFAASFDASKVQLGAAIHDAGKILHPSEMHRPGDAHEVAGRDLLIEHGHPDLARFCTTHAKWDEEGVALEDLLVALADKLWKGKRVAELERRATVQLAAASGADFWDVFVLIDEVFERVAARGDERLQRSQSPCSVEVLTHPRRSGDDGRR